jgi:hypothetical protein
MEVGQNRKDKIGHASPWTLILLVVVTLLGGGPILYGCDSSNQDWRLWKERNNMELARGQSSHMVAIPPIDIEAPSKMETATFALG